MPRKIPKNSIVEMSHTLNTMRDGYATKQEQRLFLVYLARINPRDSETLSVRLSLDEFCDICEIQNKHEISKLKKLTESILQKLVVVGSKNGGWKNYVLFDESSIDQDENGEWYFELCASKKAIFHFIDLKQYVKFPLNYALKLKSLNQMRMYALLKDEQWKHTFRIDIEELREILGLSKKYTEYKNFRRAILDVCQKEINAITDIEFDYKGIKGKGSRGTPIVAIEFTVRQKTVIKAEENIMELPATPMNEQPKQDYYGYTPTPINDQDEEYMISPKLGFDGVDLIYLGKKHIYVDEVIENYACACEFVFSEVEMRVIADLVEYMTPIYSIDEDREGNIRTNISRHYKELLRDISNQKSKGKKVDNPYSYFVAILKRKLKEHTEKSAFEQVKLEKRVDELIRDDVPLVNAIEIAKDEELNSKKYTTA